MKKIYLCFLVLLLSGCSWGKTQNLEATLVNIHEVQVGEAQTWAEFCSKDTINLDEWERQDSICKEFSSLHEEWEQDFRFLVLDYDEAQKPIRGLTYLSGKNVDLYTQEFKKSFDITEQIRRTMAKNLDDACKVCNEKQKIQAPCILECPGDFLY